MPVPLHFQVYIVRFFYFKETGSYIFIFFTFFSWILELSLILQQMKKSNANLEAVKRGTQKEICVICCHGCGYLCPKILKVSAF